MRLREDKLAQVVKQEGPKLQEAGHIHALVNTFMRNQKYATQYVVAHDKELGAEGIVTTLLHAEIICRAISLEVARKPPTLTMKDLDVGAHRAKEPDALVMDQPAVLDYLRANVDTDSGFTEEQVKVAHSILTLIVLSFDAVL